MKPRRVLIYLILLLVVVVFVILIRIPQTTGGPALLLATESLVIRRVGAQALESVYDRRGIAEEHSSNLIQLSSTDFAVTQIWPRVAVGDEVSEGDTLLLVNSSLSEGLLAEASSDLKKAEAERRLLLSDPKLDELSKKKSEVKQAEAVYEAARREFNRDKELHRKSLISENDYESSSARFNVAYSAWQTKKSELKLLQSAPKAEEIERIDAELEKLRARRDYLREQVEASVITSSFDGVLVGNAERGDVFTLARVESLVVEIALKERDLDILSPGSKVELRLAAYPSLPYEGEVLKMKLSPHLTAIAVVDNSRKLLLPQMHGYAKVDCGKISIAGLLLREVSRFFRLEFWSWF
jgi:multidrug efflux pump subunit AcrA (membrane-fusion protein)